MNLKLFATQNNLKTTLDSDGTRIIPGIDDSHIYEFDSQGQLGVMYIDSRGSDSSEHLKSCLKAGMCIQQQGSQDKLSPCTNQPR
jgi:hypothetical protein